jgi:hypothetical protein
VLANSVYTCPAGLFNLTIFSSTFPTFFPLEVGSRLNLNELADLCRVSSRLAVFVFWQWLAIYHDFHRQAGIMGMDRHFDVIV